MASDFKLSPEVEELRRMVRAFVEEIVVEVAAAPGAGQAQLGLASAGTATSWP